MPLELGGAPAATMNLYPENRREFPGAGEKDQLENYLHDAVCAAKMPLEQAQRTIATDWVAAYCANKLTECPDGVHLMQATHRPGLSSDR